MKRLRNEGWLVELVYLALPNVEMSKLRVAERVAHGGHNIPTQAIERRFSRSLVNLMREFRFQVTRSRCFMNIGTAPEPVFEQYQGLCNILHDDYFQWIMKETGL